MPLKILHIAECEKFIPPYVEFIKENFNFKQHEFVIANGMAIRELKITPNVHLSNTTISSKLKHYILATIKMHTVDRVILHGLFNSRLVVILFFMPWLLKKCYWIMWGGDFYFPEKQMWIKKQVIKKMGNLVTATTGDYEYAVKNYGAKGKRFSSFSYTSNLFDGIYAQKINPLDTIIIQVGNSADPTNNHLEILKSLEKFINNDIMIVAPLSYGDDEYARHIISKGKEIFGNKFQPITTFMSAKDYAIFQDTVDIAIFNHSRQQALGNTVNLLGLGKKVYIRKESTLNNLFKEYGITVYDADCLNLDLLEDKIAKRNSDAICLHFSKNALVKSLKIYLE